MAGMFLVMALTENENKKVLRFLKTEYFEILTQSFFLIDLSGNLIKTYKLLKRLGKFDLGRI